MKEKALNIAIATVRKSYEKKNVGGIFLAKINYKDFGKNSIVINNRLGSFHNLKFEKVGKIMESTEFWKMSKKHYSLVD